MILIDTHVLVWWMQGEGRLTQAQKMELRQVSPDNPAWLSDISLWEISMLHSRGRIELQLPLAEFLSKATAPPLIKVQPITPEIATAVAELPRTFHGDPADRLIVATAKVHGAVLLTVDRGIIDAGLVSVCR